jgi:hypothetical protein
MFSPLLTPRPRPELSPSADRYLGIFLDFRNEGDNLLGSLGGLFGEFAHLFRHNSKAPSGLSGSSSLNRRVQIV